MTKNAGISILVFIGILLGLRFLIIARKYSKKKHNLSASNALVLPMNCHDVKSNENHEKPFIDIKTRDSLSFPLPAYHP